MLEENITVELNNEELEEAVGGNDKDSKIEFLTSKIMSLYNKLFSLNDSKEKEKIKQEITMYKRIYDKLIKQ